MTAKDTLRGQSPRSLQTPGVPALSPWVSAILTLPLTVQGPSGAKHLLEPEVGSTGQSSGGWAAGFALALWRIFFLPFTRALSVSRVQGCVTSVRQMSACLASGGAARRPWRASYGVHRSNNARTEFRGHSRSQLALRPDVGRALTHSRRAPVWPWSPTAPEPLLGLVPKPLYRDGCLYDRSSHSTLPLRGHMPSNDSEALSGDPSTGVLDGLLEEAGAVSWQR